ncbi:MAG: hypothetical protein WBP51_16885, partial [Candidatus Sulfotelmatobacter sp.]
MNTPRLPFPIQNDPSPSDQNKPDFRTKIVATRLTPRELAAIEAAAESSSQSLAEWLRETVLRAARQRPADPVELLLAEVWALRYTLLNLFYSRAQAESDGTELLPDSIAKIRDQADTRKLQQARKILEDFL